LYAREKTGKGQVVDTSLMGSLIAMLGFILAAPAILGQEFPRELRATAGNPLYNHYRCKDDKWIAIAHLDPDRYWSKICKALGVEQLQHDPRFNSIESRGENAQELVSVLDQRFAIKTRAEWTKILAEAGCIFTPVQTPLEVSNDPQALANQYFIDVQHPIWGGTKMVGFPWDFSETPASVQREAPALGQHTEEILSGLGYGKDVIAKFREEGVIQ
ncbi:MAG: putative acyl-CoA transferase/carnitine dehydratase, partial [Deltaproteobacteria bacterium]|nr:putative acyl-CoA transferase/carnitine dehydratase [Deltaproteobacteria bacterium]